jgi:hypothetical protein
MPLFMTKTFYVEIEVEVSFTYHKAIPGHRDKYGAPEEPDEPAYVEIDSVTYDGKDIILSESDMETLQKDVDDYDPEDWDKD